MDFVTKLQNRSDGDLPEISSVPAGGTDVWEKWHVGSLYVFYVLLGLATVLALFAGNLDSTRGLTAVSVSLFLGTWHYFSLHRRLDVVYRNASAILLYFIVGLALLAILIQASPFYNFMAFIIFWQNFSLWGMRYAIPGAVAGSLYMTWTNSDFANLITIFDSPQAIGPLLISIPVSIALSLFIASIIRQSSERRRLVEELEATRAELAKEERRAGILEERSRLAREIHDTLAQGFIGIVTHLEAFEESPTSEAKCHVEQARRMARENLAEARRLVAALRPELLEGSSLDEAMVRLCQSWSSASGIPANLKVTGDACLLLQDVQVALFRAAQESLSNVRRHADAREVNLTLSYSDDVVLLDVHDDGRGFDLRDIPQNAEGGFGLRAMRERIEYLGGHLSVESESGVGTTISASLPTRREKR